MASKLVSRLITAACFALTAVVEGASPYAGLAGAPSVNPLKDGCWKNVSLSASGKRALIISTSYGKKMSNGKPTGLALEEATAPYYVFQDAGMTVDVASILGGAIPIGETTPTPSQLRYKLDKAAKVKFAASKKIDNVTFPDYDVVFMAGGWGAAFDLGFSQVLGGKVAAALETGRPLLGSTCHGALGFAMANRSDGTPWVKGLTMTGVTDAQIRKLGISNQTPMHPEDELRKLGANYQSIAGSGLLGDVGATSTVVDTQGPVVVTGQNQNSACVAAQRQLLFLTAGGSQPQPIFAWVPEGCTSKVQLCYQGAEEAVNQAARVDPLNPCRYGGHAVVKNGTCASYGYSAHIRTPFGNVTHDPVFRRVTLWTRARAESLLLV